MINDTESTKNLAKIKSISTVVRILALIGLILFIIVQVPGEVSVGASNDAAMSIDINNVPRSLTDILAKLPSQLSVIGAFYWVFRLFGVFRNGDIFTDSSVRASKLLAISVILIGVNSLLFGLYKWGLEMILNGGQTVDLNIDLYGTHFLMVGFGLLLYAVALVQREAKTRTEDLKLIF